MPGKGCPLDLTPTSTVAQGSLQALLSIVGVRICARSSLKPLPHFFIKTSLGLKLPQSTTANKENPDFLVLTHFFFQITCQHLNIDFGGKESRLSMFF